MSTESQLDHDRVFELLPWLVNGSLAPGERDNAERHVRACLVCRRGLKEQQRLRAAIAAHPAVHISAQTGLEQLDRRIDGGEHPAERVRFAHAAPFALAAAAGGALLAFLLWIVPLPAPSGDAYTTLAAPTSTPLQALDVVFAADATEAELRALLDSVGGEIIAGPSAIGRYRIQVAASSASGAGLAQVIESLSAHPRVRLVTPAFAGEAQ